MQKFRFRDLSINTKFLLSLCLMLIFPLMILFAFINTNVTKEIKTQACNTVLETLKQAKTPLYSMVNDADYLSKEILSNAAVQEYLRKCTEQAPQDLYEYRYRVDLYLAQLLDSRAYILRAALFSGSEMVVQSGAYLDTDSLPPAVAELNLAKNGLYWSAAEENQRYLSRYERGQEVTLLRAVNDVSNFGVTLGTEKLTIRESYICSLYSGVANEQTHAMFLMDDEGNIVSALDKTMLGTNASALPYYEKIRQRPEGYLFDSQNEVVSFCRLDSPGWYLVRVDSKNLVEKGGVINAVILLCIALTVVFGAVFFTIQRRNIIHPITELSEEVKSFHDGNYTFTERRNARDEIGVLNRACVEMGQYIQDLIERVYKSQLAEKETQLRYLQSQINPHFLYNTLDAIRWMAIRNHQPDIARQTEALARLLKHALNGGRELTTVGEELTHLQDYITIQTNRFGDRIEVLVEPEEECKNCTVLNLLLQPLVENSIVHGLENKLGHGVVEVKVFREADTLCYTVEDNGLGTDAEAIRRALNGEENAPDALALTNIQKRLRYKYGEPYGLKFESERGKGTRVTVTMPFTTGETIYETTDCGR